MIVEFCHHSYSQYIGYIVYNTNFLLQKMHKKNYIPCGFPSCLSLRQPITDILSNFPFFPSLCFLQFVIFQVFGEFSFFDYLLLSCCLLDYLLVCLKSVYKVLYINAHAKRYQSSFADVLFHSSLVYLNSYAVGGFVHNL